MTSSIVNNLLVTRHSSDLFLQYFKAFIVSYPILQNVLVINKIFLSLYLNFSFVFEKFMQKYNKIWSYLVPTLQVYSLLIYLFDCFNNLLSPVGAAYMCMDIGSTCETWEYRSSYMHKQTNKWMNGWNESPSSSKCTANSSLVRCWRAPSRQGFWLSWSHTTGLVQVTTASMSSWLSRFQSTT